jgi:hypothetical protein
LTAADSRQHDTWWPVHNPGGITINRTYRDSRRAKWTVAATLGFAVTLAVIRRNVAHAIPFDWLLTR